MQNNCLRICRWASKAMQCNCAIEVSIAKVSVLLPWHRVSSTHLDAALSIQLHHDVQCIITTHTEKLKGAFVLTSITDAADTERFQYLIAQRSLLKREGRIWDVQSRLEVPMWEKVHCGLGEADCVVAIKLNRELLAERLTFRLESAYCQLSPKGEDDFDTLIGSCVQDIIKGLEGCLIVDTCHERQAALRTGPWRVVGPPLDLKKLKRSPLHN